MSNPSVLPISVDRLTLNAADTGRYRLDHVPDEALHIEVKTLVGRKNTLTAELLAHLAEVDARGIYRERACSSLYTYCIYELRFSEDEAQRRVRAARAAREFPVLFGMLAEGAIHLTGLLLLAPCLTADNHADLLARARFRTKREIECLVSEIAPRPDVPARIEPLGPRPAAPANLWQAYTASLRGPVRELAPGGKFGQAPATVAFEQPAPVEAPPAEPKSLALLRYRVEFTASQEYVELLEEARNLLQHQVPDRDVARVHEIAMAAFVEQLRKRRQSTRKRPRPPVANDATMPVGAPASDGPAPARAAAGFEGAAPARAAARSDAASRRYVPVEIRRAVWERDAGRCTFTDEGGRRCRERAGLELHHERAFALGGPTTLENLRLMCRAHNGLFAERDFGRAYVQRVKNGPREPNRLLTERSLR